MSDTAVTTGAKRRDAPAPGAAPLPAANAAALLRRNASDADIARRPAVRFGERVWTHGDYVAECRRWANLFVSRRPAGRPFHVGVLLDNVPDYLFALGGAALCGAAIVGLNHTRRGESLLRDITHTDVAMIVTEPRHQPLLEPIVDQLDVPEGNLWVSRRFAGSGDPQPRVGGSLEEALADAGDGDPGVDDPSPDSIWALVFTSGTSDAPKAVICTQRRIMVTGNRMGIMLGLGPDDVGYVSMPLFHSNAVMVGWAPSIVYGGSVGLARRFSASRWLDDVRRYGATYFNYTGKPLAYLLAQPELPDDADNTLRIAFGNEGSPQVVDTFSARFGVEVVDAFGATEGGVAVNREPGMPPGAMGRVGDAVKVVDEDGRFLPPARFDTAGRLANAEECVGEIVSTAGAGPFEGYYNNPEANARATRRGWYWSGDLGYVDPEGYLYFAGRTAEWIRVDGENFPAGPIESALSLYPDVVVAAAYGVPDEQAGDQVMACLVLRDGARTDGAALAAWIDAQNELAPKWRPRYIRVTSSMPVTATNKIVKRTLVHQKFRSDRTGGDEIFFRGRGDPAYRRLTTEDERQLEASFTAAGRQRFWDL